MIIGHASCDLPTTKVHRIGISFRHAAARHLQRLDSAAAFEYFAHPQDSMEWSQIAPPSIRFGPKARMPVRPSRWPGHADTRHHSTNAPNNGRWALREVRLNPGAADYPHYRKPTIRPTISAIWGRDTLNPIDRPKMEWQLSRRIRTTWTPLPRTLNPQVSGSNPEGRTMVRFLDEYLAGEKGRAEKTINDYRYLHHRWFSPTIGSQARSHESTARPWTGCSGPCGKPDSAPPASTRRRASTSRSIGGPSDEV